MGHKSNVFWASAVEKAALENTKNNMITNNLVKTSQILDLILDNIKNGDKVGIKIHVGEAYNTHYLRHDYIREVVRIVKEKGGLPSLIETHGLGSKPETIEMSDRNSICIGVRKNTRDHSLIAHQHGYVESITGAPLNFIDGEKGIEAEQIKINGIHLKDVSVAAGLFNFDKLIVLSHFKGHMNAVFGGALKQLGMGCVTKRNKFRAHYEEIKITDNCSPSECNSQCKKLCPTKAITEKGNKMNIDYLLCIGCFACTRACEIKNVIQAKLNSNRIFTERMIDNAKGVITGFGKENIRYLNFAIDITLHCDCIPNAGPPIIPDLGILGSSDPVALDKACIDAETNAPNIPKQLDDGKWTEPIPVGIEKFQKLFNSGDVNWQFDAAIRNELGNIDYKLIKI